MTTITDREHLMVLEADLANARERIAELEAALEPFAKEAGRYDPPEFDDHHIAWASNFTFGQLRRARALLKKEGGGQALLRHEEAVGAQAMTDWQPIETAPKDGTKILVGRFAPGEDFDGRIRVDWWRSQMKSGFVGFGHFNPMSWPATHWMPLPKPPPPEPRE